MSNKKQAGNNRMPLIFGGILLVIIVLIVAGTLSKNYDKTAESNSNLYKNEISLDALKQQVDGKQDFFAYFYQPSCEHCKIVSPILIPLAEKMNKPLKPVNIYQQHDAWTTYKVEGTPTLVHFKDGKEVDRIVGEHGIEDFSAFLSKSS